MNVLSLINILEESQQNTHDSEQSRILYFLNGFVEFVVRQPNWTIQQFFKDNQLNGYRFILDLAPYKYYQIIVFRESNVLEIQFKNGVYLCWFEWKVENGFTVDSVVATPKYFRDKFEYTLDSMFKRKDV